MPLTSPRFAHNQRLQDASQNKPPIGCGAEGEAVRIIQQALIDLGHPLPISVRKYGSPDGIYGAETTAAVRAFQRKQGLSADGITGKDTLAAMDRLLRSPVDPLPPLPGKGQFMHRIRVHMRTINMPAVSEFTQFEEARRIYAQYSIDFFMASGMSLLLTDEERLKLTIVDGDCKWDQVSDDQRLLQDLGGRQGVGPTDIIVYFASVLRETDGEELQGCAGHAPSRPAAMVSATAIDKTTMAHEVGHVLLGSGFTPVHHPDSNNLMCEAAVCTGNPAFIDDKQLAAIRSSRFIQKLT